MRSLHQGGLGIKKRGPGFNENNDWADEVRSAFSQEAAACAEEAFGHRQRREGTADVVSSTADTGKTLAAQREPTVH